MRADCRRGVGSKRDVGIEAAARLAKGDKAVEECLAPVQALRRLAAIAVARAEVLGSLWIIPEGGLGAFEVTDALLDDDESIPAPMSSMAFSGRCAQFSPPARSVLRASSRIRPGGPPCPSPLSSGRPCWVVPPPLLPPPPPPPGGGPVRPRPGGAKVERESRRRGRDRGGRPLDTRRLRLRSSGVRCRRQRCHPGYLNAPTAISDPQEAACAERHAW